MSSGKRNKQKFSRKRKKKPPVNLYLRTNISNVSPEKVTPSISEKMLIIDQTSHNNNSEVISQEGDYFLFINFSILKSVFSPLLVCPECAHKTITLSDNRQKRKGFSHNLELFCQSCKWFTSIFISKECIKPNHGQGQNSTEV